MTLGRLLLLAVLGGLAWWLMRDDTVIHGPGVVAPHSPTQSEPTDAAPFEHRGYTIVPLAEFEIEARVLGRERYRHDREAELSPLDLALGWGPMSDEQVLDRLEISQGGRWYRWRARELPIARADIERHSANMHMVPRDELVGGILDAIRPGEVVALRGWLVEARATDGWRWRSSLTREDSGARACELVFVRHARVVRSG